MGPSVCVKFAHVINETCDRPQFSLITYANLSKTEKMHCRLSHRREKHWQLLGRCTQSIFRMCTPTLQLLSLAHFCKCADLLCICSISEWKCFASLKTVPWHLCISWQNDAKVPSDSFQ